MHEDDSGEPRFVKVCLQDDYNGRIVGWGVYDMEHGAVPVVVDTADEADTLLEYVRRKLEEQG